MRPSSFSEIEDGILLTLRDAGKRYAEIAAVMPGHCERTLSYRYHVLRRRMGLTTNQAGNVKRKQRTCLFGRHPFNARIDEDGRYLEFTCSRCRQSEGWRGANLG